MRTRVEVLGLTPRRAAGLRAGARVAALLAGLPPEVSSGRVTFTDENAGEGWARRALRHHRQHAGPAPPARGGPRDVAAAGAGWGLTKVERRLARTRAMDRQKRRRPKTYYAAARVR